MKNKALKITITDGDDGSSPGTFRTVSRRRSRRGTFRKGFWRRYIVAVARKGLNKSTCPNRCKEFKECVQCLVFKTGSITPEECIANCTFELTVMDVVEDRENPDKIFCAYFDEDDCRFTYIYSYDKEDKIVIKAKKERECPQPVNFL
ncbi:Integrin beta-1, partial [Homalodisca vitripennis]